MKKTRKKPSQVLEFVKSKIDNDEQFSNIIQVVIFEELERYTAQVQFKPKGKIAAGKLNLGQKLYHFTSWREIKGRDEKQAREKVPKL